MSVLAVGKTQRSIIMGICLLLALFKNNDLGDYQHLMSI